MSTVVVPCPHCRKQLKLRDRSKLGQKAKCPACAKTFVLAEPQAEDEVVFEVVDAAPAVGKAAQWVPDDDPPARAATGPAVNAMPQLQTAPARGAVVSNAASPLVAIGGDADGLQRLREIRRRSARRRNIAILFGGLTALVIAGGAWGYSLWKQQAPSTAAPTRAAQPAPQVALATGVPGPPSIQSAGVGVPMPSVTQGPSADSFLAPHQELTRPQLRDNEALVAALAPRQGDPIRLYMVPSGMNVVIHLRPSKLWSDDAVWQEFRYSLTEDVTNWIAAKLKEVCRREPQQIDECLICLRLGATGTEPALSTVVHFAEEAKLSDLIEEFAGEPLSDGPGPRINTASPYSYLIKDTQTIAIVPEEDRFELPEVITVPNPNPTEGIYRLLDLTDRERAFTILFEVDDVKRHENWLFSERTRPVFRRILNWFGDDVETVAWSVDVDGDSVVSDILLRNRSIVSSARLSKDVLLRLETLPQDLVAACQRMRPASKGYQAIIGRFPAMMEAYRLATIPTVDSRHVRLTTVLPRKAAPNLALGTLLTWDLSTQTDFSTAAPPAAAIAAASPDMPATVEGRLKQTMLEGEFSNPFQDAIAYIAAETKTTIDIDGNALKDAGYTKNMPVKLNLGRVSGMESLRRIFAEVKPPAPDKKLSIVIDETAGKVLVTTNGFAAASGQTVYPLETE